MYFNYQIIVAKCDVGIIWRCMRVRISVIVRVEMEDRKSISTARKCLDKVSIEERE